MLSDLDVGVAEFRAAQKELTRYRQSLLKALVFNRPVECNGVETRARVEFADMPALAPGWHWVQLRELLVSSSNGTSGKCRESRAAIPVIRIPNIAAGKVRLEKLKYAVGNELKLTDEDYLRCGDVLIVGTNGSIKLVGRAAAISANLPSGFYFASYLLRLRCVEGSVIPVWIPIALLEQMRRVVDCFEQLKGRADETNAEISKGLQTAAAQRQNILEAAFSGQLVPQDATDEPASVLLERIRAERAARPVAKSTRSRKPKATA